MKTHLAALAAATCLMVGPAFANPSGQHSAQAVNHSGQAASESSAAVLSGGATIVAVPIILFGATLSISGAALESVGNGAIDAGSELSRVGNAPLYLDTTVTPNGPPRLD